MEIKLWSPQLVASFIESTTACYNIETFENSVQSGPKKCIHSLLINIFGINLNEISISG